MDSDDLRRIDRLTVCCRVDVHDRFGPWTAVTEDVCARGCRIVTDRLPALGSVFAITLSSDLFPEVLEVRARVVWGTSSRIGVAFIEGAPRKGALTPTEWLDLVVEHGRPANETGIRAVERSPRVVPAIIPAAAPAGRQGGEQPQQPRRDPQGKVIPLPRSG